MSHYLLEQYPQSVALISDFSDAHPEIFTLRKCRTLIARIADQPEAVQRVFRKRFGRWYIHVPSLVEYLEAEDPLLDCRERKAS